MVSSYSFEALKVTCYKATMQTRMKRILSMIAGWTFIVLGIAGLFLPFLQGILFLAVGLIILSNHYAFAQRWLDTLKHRYPAAFEMAHDFRVRLMKRLQKGNNKEANDTGSPDQPPEPRLIHRSD